jgi:hypothetical protein
MICIGYGFTQKQNLIQSYITKNAVCKIFAFQPEDRMFDYGIEAQYITYRNLIEYEFFYKVLQEADKHTLIIVDECLRTQNRNDLTYNCLRHFINQAGHVIIFQYFPIIDDVENFMILFDFDTKSRWKREKFSVELLRESDIRVNRLDLVFEEQVITCSERVKSQYIKEKKKLFENIGLKDPHTIPRNLYLVSGKEKAACVNSAAKYIGRNNRFKIGNMFTYKQPIPVGEYVVFEFPHNLIDFTDFLYFSKQTRIPVMTTDLKVDQWYLKRYYNWLNNLNRAYNSIIQ